MAAELTQSKHSMAMVQFIVYWVFLMFVFAAVFAGLSYVLVGLRADAGAVAAIPNRELSIVSVVTLMVKSGTWSKMKRRTFFAEYPSTSSLVGSNVTASRESSSSSTLGRKTSSAHLFVASPRNNSSFVARALALASSSRTAARPLARGPRASARPPTS